MEPKGCWDERGRIVNSPQKGRRHDGLVQGTERVEERVEIAKVAPDKEKLSAPIHACFSLCLPAPPRPITSTRCRLVDASKLPLCDVAPSFLNTKRLDRPNFYISLQQTLFTLYWFSIICTSPCSFQINPDHNHLMLDACDPSFF